VFIILSALIKDSGGPVWLPAVFGFFAYKAMFRKKKEPKTNSESNKTPTEEEVKRQAPIVSSEKTTTSKYKYHLIGGFVILMIILLAVGRHKNSNKQNKTIPENEIFEDSFKKQINEGKIENDIDYYDSITNIYSNFEYRVAFDAPNDWKFDAGVSKHTIFRTYQPDSAITFTINVIELKLSNKSKAPPNIWEVYQKNKDKMDYPFKVLIPKRFNSKSENYKVSKSYIKNQLSLKRSFSYMVRDLDYEYSNTSIVYQTFLDNYTYTFGLDLPTVFYEENPDYYERLFLNIYFLLNKEDLNKFMNKNGNQNN